MHDCSNMCTHTQIHTYTEAQGGMFSRYMQTTCGHAWFKLEYVSKEQVLSNHIWSFKHLCLLQIARRCRFLGNRDDTAHFKTGISCVAAKLVVLGKEKKRESLGEKLHGAPPPCSFPFTHPNNCCKKQPRPTDCWFSNVTKIARHAPPESNFSESLRHVSEQQFVMNLKGL